MKTLSKKTVTLISICAIILIGGCFLLFGGFLSKNEEPETTAPLKTTPLTDKLEKTKPDLDAYFLKDINFNASYTNSPLILDSSISNVFAFGTDDVVYIFNAKDSGDGTGYFHVIDMKSGNIYPLCQDKYCNHESTDCTSYLQESIFGNDISAFIPYEQKIYVIGRNRINNSFLLSSMNLDGSEKAQIGTITPEITKDEYSIYLSYNNMYIHNGYLYFSICHDNKKTPRTYAISKYKIDGSENPVELYTSVDDPQFYLDENIMYLLVPKYGEHTYDELLLMNLETGETTDVSSDISKKWNVYFTKNNLFLSNELVTNNNGTYLFFYENEKNLTYDETDMGYFLYDINTDTTSALDINSLSETVKKDILKSYGSLYNAYLTNDYIVIPGSNQMYIFDYDWNLISSFAKKVNLLGYYNSYTFCNIAESDRKPGIGEIYIYEPIDKKTLSSIYIGQYSNEKGKYIRKFVKNIYLN